MKKNTINVLIVGPTPPQIGGIATYISDLLNSDLNDKFNLLLYSTNYPENSYENPLFSKNNRSDRNKSQFIYIPYMVFIAGYKILKFTAVLIKEKPCLVHIHTASYLSFFENSLYIIISKICGIKSIIHIHGGAFRSFYNDSFKVTKYYIRYVMNITDKIICLSSHWNEFFINELNINQNKINVINNGYDSSFFYPQDETKCKKCLKLPLDKKIILTVGNLLDEKGQRYLIESMKYVIEERKNVLCIIIGDGNMKNELENTIKNFNLECYVNLVGSQPHDQIPVWMNACDLFVLPSLIESFGLVQIEAMACGKPIVATINGGSEEIIISDEYGLLCESKNAKLLSENILVALNKNFNTSNILSYANSFKWSLISNKISRQYEDLLYEN